jgi:hypothetical protein
MKPGHTLLRHGTTLRRAEAIMKSGPDPKFREPNSFYLAEAFSMAPLKGPFSLGSPEVVAAGKAALFPNEGGPAILEIEMPDHLIASATDLVSEVRFAPEKWLKELVAAWASLEMRIVVP